VKIVAMFSTKGGVGKSTATANFATVMLLEDRKVYAMDYDPNNTLRFHYGLNQSDTNGHSSLSLQGLPIKNAITKIANGTFVLPFGELTEDQLNQYQEKLLQDPFFLKKQIDSLGLSDDEILFIDAPSGSTIFTQQVLNAAHVSVVVMLADAASYLTLEGSLKLINKHCIGRKDYLGTMYLVNQIQRKYELNSDIFDMVQMQLENHIIAEVHQDQCVPEALARGTNVLTDAPESLATQDFIDAAQTMESFLLGPIV
jgi:cellulose synthase operon protein YhjQ